MASKDLDIQILPFYDNPNKTSRFNKYCDSKCIYDHVTNQNYLPSFILQRGISLSKVKTFRVECLDGSSPQDIDLFASIPTTKFYTISEIRGALPSSQFVVLDDGTTINDQFTNNANNIGLYNFTSFSFVWREPEFNEIFINQDTGTLWFWNETSWVDTGLTDLWDIKTIKDKDFVVWQGWRLNNILNPGIKQVFVEDDDGNKWYSEPINIVCNTDNYNILRWRNNEDVGCIPYSRFTNFFQTLYINCDAVQPEYPKTIETEEDNFGIEKVTFQKFNKLYNLNMAGVPEYVSDNMNFIALHDDITVKLNNQEEFFTVDKSSIDISTTWENECDALIGFRFSYEKDIITTGCNEGLEFRDFEFYNNTLPAFRVKSIELFTNRVNVEASSVPGDCYIIEDIPNVFFFDEWSSHKGEIGCWNGSSWEYTTPNNLDLVFVESDSSVHLLELTDPIFPTFPPSKVKTYIEQPGFTLNLVHPQLIEVSFNILNNSDLFLRIEHSVDGTNFTKEGLLTNFQRKFDRTIGLLPSSALHYVRVTLFNNNSDPILTSIKTVS